MRLILGCGRIGYAIAKELEDRGEEVLIIDIDEKRVDFLTDEDFTAFVGDIGDPKVLKKLLKEIEPEKVFIMSNSSEGNKKAVRNLKDALPDAHMIVRAVDPGDKDELPGLGVDLVLSIPDLTARAVLDELRKADLARTVRGLVGVMGALKAHEDARLAIVVHDSPDPDAIASALALKHIARHEGVAADIMYRGEIGHHVNRAFVNILGIEMKRIAQPEDLQVYPKRALVDARLPGVNNPIPAEGGVDIIIDHHAANNEAKIKADFVDVRPDRGATSTILTEYLRVLDIPVDKILATALLHGIRTDTSGFKRETHPADFSAAAFLHVKADKELLDQIEAPPMSTEMLNVVGDAILNKKIRGSYLITNVGSVVNRDSIPMAADYLLNLEGIATVIVIGLYEETIVVSGRSKDVRVNIGDAFARAFAEIGSAGGHASMAAAQIPLGIFSGLKDKNTIMQLVEDAVSKRFLSVMKADTSE
ncbi:MAG TPA: potassium transporter TrkA [Methanomicrobia archaeon]|nr:potassium transporter TrkA [Methanomicrobia archaeon]